MVSAGKKIFYAILFAVLLYVLFFLLTQSKFFTAKLVQILVNRSDGPVKIVEIKFEDHLFDFPEFLQMNDVTLVLSDRMRKRWDVNFDSLSLNCEKCLRGEKPQGSFNVKNLNMKSEDGVVVSGTSLDFRALLKDRRIWKSYGDVNVEHIDYYGIILDNFKTYITGYKHEILMRDIWAQISGGIIKGEIFLESKENVPYSVNMRFVDVDVDAMGSKAHGIKSNIRGVFDGFLEMSGNVKRIDKISGRLIASENGQIHSRLIGHLMSYLPGSAVAKQLSDLIKANQFVGLDDFEITFSNTSKSVLFTNTRMLSHVNGLDANVDININLGTDILKLLQLLKGR